MSRAYVHNGDIDVAAVVGMAAADGWHAEYTGDLMAKPLLFWVLLNDGSLIGVVSEIGASIGLEVRAADKVLNFQGTGAQGR